MPAIIPYLLKLSLSIAMIHAFYYLVLRRLTFYNLNRWYLLGYSLLCFIIRFINIAAVAKQAGKTLPAMHYIPAMQNLKGYYMLPATAQHQTLDIWQAVTGLLMVGSLFMLVKLVMQFASLIRIKNKAVMLSDNGAAIYHVEEQIAPFSFGNAIYLNKNMHTGRELEEIILHEYVHVKQKHTADILMAELLCIINWYNPFAWLIRHSIRQNLEFIADDNVMRSGMDKKAYQYHLLKVVGIPQYRIANQFNFSSLKKRIMMMNRAKTSRIHLVKFLFILPLLAVTLMAFRQEITTTIGRHIPAALKKHINATFNYTAGTGIIKKDTSVKAALKNDLKSGPYHLEYNATGSTDVNIYKGFIMLYGNATISNSTGEVHAPVIKLNNFDKKAIIDFKKALVLVDGKKGSINDVDQSQIESAIVLQSIAATQLFGEKGRYGAIIYNMKHDVALNDTSRHYSVDVYTETYPATDTKAAKNGYGVVLSSGNASSGKGLSSSQSASGSGNLSSSVNSTFSANRSTGSGYSISSSGGGYTTGSSLTTYNGKAYNSTYGGKNTMLTGVAIPADEGAMIYIIDPKAVDISQFDGMTKAFKENGFDLKFSEDYKANVLHTLGITLSTSKGGSSTSESSQFNIDEMQDGKQYIKVLADKKTGDIAIVTIPKADKL